MADLLAAWRDTDEGRAFAERAEALAIIYRKDLSPSEVRQIVENPPA